MTPEELAENLKMFFQFFDAMFMVEEETEELLLDTKNSLEEKINRNESALICITALGGRYDSGLDKAKFNEVKAILDLIKARKDVRNITIEQARNKNRNDKLLKDLFGV